MRVTEGPGCLVLLGSGVMARQFPLVVLKDSIKWHNATSDGSVESVLFTATMKCLTASPQAVLGDTA